MDKNTYSNHVKQTHRSPYQQQCERRYRVNIFYHAIFSMKDTKNILIEMVTAVAALPQPLLFSATILLFAVQQMHIIIEYIHVCFELLWLLCIYERTNEKKKDNYFM